MADLTTAETEATAAPDVAKLRRQYLDFVDAKRAERQESQQARHYYHGDQWTATDRNTLALRKQPDTTYNRIARKINGVIGVLERLRQDPKAFPRTPEHAEG